MSIDHDFSGCLQTVIGDLGLTDAEFLKWHERASNEALKLKQFHAEGAMPLMRIPSQRDDIDLAREKFYELIEGCEVCVFMGIGGSSLGGQTIAQLGGWFIPGDRIKKGKNAGTATTPKLPRTRIFDNLDARSLELGISLLDLETSRFVITSKSGNTADTLLQAITVISAFKEAGLESLIGKTILGISEPRQEGVRNGLRDLLEDYGCQFLEHEKDIGGRYSCLTNVGLIMAIARGLDPYALRAGAQVIVDQIANDGSYVDVMPVNGAAVSIGLNKERGVSNMVMMPYADQMARFSNWYVQLWAESLGKNGGGTTPIAALGPVDQHSQLQLFMDGPRDKLISIIACETEGKGPFIAEDLAKKAGLDFLAGRTVGDLVAAQARATCDALRQAGQATRFTRVSVLDEFTLGQLLMSYMIETVIAAGLLGVNAYDQPAVEVSKNLARDSLRV